jgi:hypothetical protein
MTEPMAGIEEQCTAYVRVGSNSEIGVFLHDAPSRKPQLS